MDRLTIYAILPSLSANSMKRLPKITAALLVACVGLSSCATMRKLRISSATTASTSNQPPSSNISEFPQFSNLSLANLLPGSRVKVVAVRKKDLKELPTGRERVLAYQNKQRRGFWFFGGPVDFKEPTLPEPGSEMDGSLLPPRIP